MTAKRKLTKRDWIDPDDAPELTHELARRAQISVGGKVVREATGTLTKRGRPPVGDEAKQQVTLRLAPKVIRYFKETGEGWQTRLNETLEEYVTAVVVADVRRDSVSLTDLIKKAAGEARAQVRAKGKVSNAKLGLKADMNIRDVATGRLSQTLSASKGRRAVTRKTRKAS